MEAWSRLVIAIALSAVGCRHSPASKILSCAPASPKYGSIRIDAARTPEPWHVNQRVGGFVIRIDHSAEVRPSVPHAGILLYAVERDGRRGRALDGRNTPRSGVVRFDVLSAQCMELVLDEPGYYDVRQRLRARVGYTDTLTIIPQRLQTPAG